MKRFWNRRDFLFQSGGGLSGLALAHLLQQDGLLAATALHHGLTIVSRNTSDFLNAQAEVLNPWLV